MGNIKKILKKMKITGSLKSQYAGLQEIDKIRKPKTQRLAQPIQKLRTGRGRK